MLLLFFIWDYCFLRNIVLVYEFILINLLLDYSLPCLIVQRHRHIINERFIYLLHWLIKDVYRWLFNLLLFRWLIIDGATIINEWLFKYFILLYSSLIVYGASIINELWLRWLYYNFSLNSWCIYVREYQHENCKSESGSTTDQQGQVIALKAGFIRVRAFSVQATSAVHTLDM